MMNFRDFDISDNVLKAIDDIGFDKTTPIQSKAIPLGLNGRDITAQAQTGSGKTVAFVIPILEKVFVPDRSPQAIVLCPTRELCIQVAGEIEKLSKYIKKFKVLAVYGGQPIGKQTRVLKKGVHVVVGTPGRVIDHIERGNMDLIGIETVVLDEADEMLDMGFRQDIERILQATPHQRQTLLFSATIPQEIKRIAKNYQKNPKFIKIDSNRKNTPRITQYSFKTNHKHKFDDLCRLFDAYGIKSALIFANTKNGVDFVFKNLKKRGYPCEALHGDMSQKTRDRVMNKFRNGNVSFLVATDVASRGLDITNLDFIVNYDVPQNYDSYIHRIGRTARAGSSGQAFTLVSSQDISTFNAIKKQSKAKIIEKNIPTDSEIEDIKNKSVLKEIKKSIKTDNLEKEIELIKKNSSNDLTSEEIAAALLKKLREN
ncbi:DEAD/DEAH box helicase [uncultured Methanobrevibacter sp.]|uniref:DEAD/DEAH box helicase n=1 Tax=uncultured Methanobrevibacter sp. TaxID=253161 RepID=UPI002630492F|nr:DEAD/DEAH box helicase [uncultured Methanobrevibacter sp.]